MAYKTFTGESIKEARDAARLEFGDDFKEVDHKITVHRTGLFGLFGRKEFYQITVSYDEGAPARRGGVTREMAERMELLERIKKIGDERRRAQQMQAVPVQEAVSSGRPVGEDIAELKEMLATMMNTAPDAGKRKTPHHPGFSRVREFLLENDFGREYIERTMEHLESSLTFRQSSDDELVRATLEKWILSSFKTGLPAINSEDSPRVITLVGPTGVGKTTTLAKIGAELALGQRKRVAFITMDYYRIGAQEQLEKYAKIMNIPIYMVHSREQLEQVIDEGKADFYLLDTAGRNQKNEMQIGEIRSVLQGLALPVDVHLVISATTKYADLAEIMKNFATLRYEKIIATKVDETNTFGSLISSLSLCGKELVWLCMGQGVPDDIKLAEARDLAGRVMVQYRIEGALSHA
ncbi:MAG TPA: flagellar biosynthesis protein FlhF [Spirochaetota bacterium]|nr:flagellar biosynthesis protein FlhF [Spirochaetota bacterium]